MDGIHDVNHKNIDEEKKIAVYSFISCFCFKSPNKFEFIRAKYQMLAFVHRMPCRDDDSSTAKDLSKVRRSSWGTTLHLKYIF